MKPFLAILAATAICTAGCVNPTASKISDTLAAPSYTPPVQQVRPVPPKKDPDSYRTTDPGRKYSLVLKDADLRDVLVLLSKESGITIVGERGITGRVTINLESKKLGEALYAILKPLGYTANVDNNVIIVGRPRLVTRSFRINYIKDKRTSTSTTSVSAFGSSDSSNSGSSGSSSSSSSGSSSDANSNVKVTTTGTSDFWGALESSLEMLVFGSSGGGKREGSGFVRGEAEKKAVQEKQTTTTQQKSTSPEIAGANKPQTSVQFSAAVDDPMLHSANVSENKLKQLVVNEIAGIIQITDYPENLDKIGNFLQDVEEASKRQVLIQAHILEVTLSDSFSLGLDWRVILDKSTNLIIGQALAPANLTNVFTLTTPTANSSSNSIASLDKNLGIMGNAAGQFKNTFSIMLDAMKEQGNVNMLSSPKISALNNQKAVIKLTTKEVSWTTKTTPGTNNTNPVTDTVAQIDEVGIFLDVTPQINGNGMITMQIHPSVSEVREFSYSLDGKSSKPVIDVREIDTLVEARSGDTIVIAGLIVDKIREVKRSIPLLGDIPYMGTIFSNNQQERTKTELVIMLTPYFLNERNIEEIRKEHERRFNNIGETFHIINNLGTMVTEKGSRDWIKLTNPPHITSEEAPIPVKTPQQPAPQSSLDRMPAVAVIEAAPAAKTAKVEPPVTAQAVSASPALDSSPQTAPHSEIIIDNSPKAAMTPTAKELPKNEPPAVTQVARSATPSDEQSLYRAGVAAYKTGNCIEASQLLSRFISSYPNSYFTQDAIIYRNDCKERAR